MRKETAFAETPAAAGRTGGTGADAVKTILITNDDGIAAEGLHRLAKAASELGHVCVVAPDSQRSGASHSVTLHTEFEIYPVKLPIEGVDAYSCTGSPTDCVRVGCLYVLPRKPDLVLSGINKGYNVASDIQYSATAGAAFEGVFQGVPSIALSEGFGDCHEVSDRYLSELLAELADRPYEPGWIWNVNFPDCPLADCRGMLRNRTVSRGSFFRDSYEKKGDLEDGGVSVMVKGEYNEDNEPGTDFRAITERYVSVSRVNNIGFVGW